MMPTGGPRLPIQFKVVSPGAKPPQYQTLGAAGMDVHAYCPDGPMTIVSGETRMIPTGIATFIGNQGYALLLLARSGLASKGIVLANGIGLIDSDYQGELKVLIHNKSDKSFTISHQDRICQGMFLPVMLASLVQVDEFSTTTERGGGGWGSTGMVGVGTDKPRDNSPTLAAYGKNFLLGDIAVGKHQIDMSAGSDK